MGGKDRFLAVLPYENREALMQKVYTGSIHLYWDDASKDPKL